MVRLCVARSVVPEEAGYTCRFDNTLFSEGQAFDELDMQTLELLGTSWPGLVESQSSFAHQTKTRDINGRFVLLPALGWPRGWLWEDVGRARRLESQAIRREWPSSRY